MRNSWMTSAALALVLSSAAALAQEAQPAEGQAQPAAPIDDQQFLMLAIPAGIAEVQFGTLAVDRAEMEEVRGFAERMLQDHPPVNERLVAIAQEMGIEPPQEMDEAHQQLFQQLSEMTGPVFDTQYMRSQVQDHRVAVQLYSAKASENDGDALTTLAAETLPVVQEHLEMAEMLTQTTEQIAADQAGQDAAAQEGQDAAGLAAVPAEGQAMGDMAAGQQCTTDIDAFGTEIYGTEGGAGGIVGDEFDTLREAALTFANFGDEEACQKVLAEMRELYTQRAQVFDREAWQTGRAEQASLAVPIAQLGTMLSMGDLQDMDVIGVNGENLGEIDTVIINPADGSLQYVLLSTGGWFNTDHVPVRFQDLRISPEGETVVLPISEEVLDQAPTVERETAQADVQTWSDDVNNWWSQNITQ